MSVLTESEASVDSLDRGILQGLARDGRQTFTALARELGVSEATIRSRLSKLERSGVVQIVALCNPRTLGHQAIRLFIRVRDLTPRAVAADIARLAVVNRVALCAGAQDIFVEATCRDVEQLVGLLDEIRIMPGVASMEQLTMLEMFKDYSWEGLTGSRGQSGDTLE